MCINMFKYENSGMFVNDTVDYPFNITNSNNAFISNFWDEIDRNIKQINNEELSKIRYIWIDACNYCQTEIFLKKILLKHHDKYPVLYLHWIDYVNKDKSIYHQLIQEEIDGIYFINNPNVTKICVIDHAETIQQKEQYFELCRKLHNNRCIFIFVSKKDTPDFSNWQNIIKMASSQSESTDVDCYSGIVRSEENYFVVKPYSYSQCKDIFKTAITKIDIKIRAVSIAETLGTELRRPYYFDNLISELNKYKNVSEMPEKLDDANLMLKIFSASMDGVIAHFKNATSFCAYLEGYYNSSFVKTYSYGENSRIPFDNYVWAYGIMLLCSNDYDSVISDQFSYSNKGNNIDFKSQLVEINERVVLLFYSKDGKSINNNFVLKDYLLQMIKHSLFASKICASVLNKCYEKIDVETRETAFIALGKRYNETLASEEDICIHYLLGMEIGMLLPKIKNESITEGLGYLYKVVDNNYVVPRCNNNGISVIPVTNFEFQKFVNDGAYTSFYLIDSNKPLNEIATEYYKEIFDFIISALSGDNRKDSNCLARLLKGYEWDHYKQIAYLFSRKEDIDSTAIYKSIGTYYPNNLSKPAKWADEKNTETSRPFCNPLQPVVCVNIFEARAYAKWLSSKIDEPVRLLTYDPDYLSVIGDSEKSELRLSFISHIQSQRAFINSVENETLFYGENDIKVKEPSPVAMPNSKFYDLYDFVGNIFETQDTPFTYNYIRNNEIVRKKLKKIQDVFVDYNCPGGGLQRTEANWPPEYMGQVPAFLRNQDIGFRIVIGNHDIGQQKHKSRTLEHIYYSESGTIEIFTCSNKVSSVLEHIHIAYAKTNDNFDKDFLRSKVFFYKEKSAIVYTSKNADVNKESILLVQNGYSVFAYHLVGIASVRNSGDYHEAALKMTVRIPILPDDISVRKKMQNRSCSEWIDVIELELVNDNYVDTYIAYPINITNGYFQITDRKVRYVVRNGQEYKRHSLLNNSYLICFNSDSVNYKSTYYEEFKEKLGVNFFLPDWINIVDFIKNICFNMPASNALDLETVMAAISTIDTADLHEQINRKILNKKRKNNE